MDPLTTLPSDEVDELLIVLADQHRRDLLAYFRDSSGDSASVTELAHYIRSRGHGTDTEVAHRLHHVVLPQLADAAVIDYDARSETVRNLENPRLETMFDALTECNLPNAGPE